MKRLLVCLTFTLLCVPLWGQAPKVMLRNYSSEHGLPSSEVHKIYEDCNGYQWIGTDNGVSCFNGYSFRNFGPLDGLEDPVVSQIQEDSRNALWICSMSGRLYCKTGTKFVALHPANKMDSRTSSRQDRPESFTRPRKHLLYWDCGDGNFGSKRHAS